MRLARNWWVVLRYAWSIRLIVIAGLLSGIEVALPLVGDALPIPAGLFAGLSLLVTALAFIARLVAQKGISDE
jgi:hypothetical protein